jgi:hypothetical protein
MTVEPSQPIDRDEQLQDVVAGYLERLEAGQAEDRSALLARHPEFAVELAEFFGMRDRVDGVVVPLREAVRGEGPGSRGFPGCAAVADSVAAVGQLGDFRITVRWAGAAWGSSTRRSRCR